MRTCTIILRDGQTLVTIESMSDVLAKLRGGLFVAVPLDSAAHISGATSAIINPAHVQAVVG